MKHLPQGESLLGVGFRQFGHTLRRLPNYPQTLLFLVAYLLYNDGIQTVIALSAQFGSEELGMEQGDLITLILMVQFVAFFGALAFGYLARRSEPERGHAEPGHLDGSRDLRLCVPETVAQFFVMGGVIGIVLGGSQALSRSLFSLMIPKGQEAEYFSVYEVSERGTCWMGPLLFGLALQFTGSYRVAILSVAIFFVLGLVLLIFVNVRKAILEAGNTPPVRV